MSFVVLHLLSLSTVGRSNQDIVAFLSYPLAEVVDFTCFF